jgi:phosphonate transport system substrate-binding protein
MLPLRNKISICCLCAGLFLLATSSFASSDRDVRVLRIGLPHVIVDRQYRLMDDWQEYLQTKLQRQIEFVIRKNDSDTMDQLRLERLDFAWVADYPDADLPRELRLVAVPLYKGRPYFRSYLIVSASEPLIISLLQLKGMVFAHANTHSNVGYLDLRRELAKEGGDPDSLFRKTFFAWSHLGVVEAVAQGLADVGVVDSFVWDSLDKTRPDLTDQTRIVAQSKEFGSPPFVATRLVRKDDYAAMQRTLVGMAHDPEGQKLLKRFNLDGFVPGGAKPHDRAHETVPGTENR